MAANRQSAIAAAEKLVSRGKIDAAIKEYRKLLAENPKDVATLNRLGDLFVRLNRIDEAVRLFSQIADNYAQDGFFVKAIAIFKKIIKLDPTRLAVYERLAELYHKQGLVNEARTQYQVLIDYYQKHASPANVVQVLTRMAELEPDDPTPHVKLAELFHQDKQADKELAEYRTIAELMVRRGRIDEATQVYAKAISAAPNDIAFITDAVLGLKDEGHTAAAARLLAQAVEKNPQAEKIARLAGLGKRERTGSQPAPEVREPRVFTVNEVIGEAPAAPRDVLFVDPAIAGTLSPSPAVPPPARPTPAPPPAAADVPSEDELILEIPEEGFLPADLLAGAEVEPPPAPAAEAAPWGEVELPEVEFELEGIGEAEAVAPPSPAAAPPPAAQAAPPATIAPSSPSATSPPGAALPPPDEIVEVVEAFAIDWQFEPEPELAIEPPPESVAPPPVPVPTASVPPQPTLDLEELEKTSYEVAPPESPARRQEDLLAEAEVFAKYGLREKAHDRLREVLQLSPRNLAAHALQLQLWLEEGKHERVLQRAPHVAEVAAESRQKEPWLQVKQKLMRAGYQFDGERAIAGPPKKKRKDSVSALLEDLAGLGAVKPARPKAAPLPDLTAALDPSRTRPVGTPRPPLPPPAAAPAPPTASAEPAAPASAPARVKTPLAPPTAEPPAIVVPRPPAAPPAAPPPLPPAVAAKPADESLAWLDKVPPARPGRATGGETLFEDEEGFFDLAAELEQELSKDDLAGGKAVQPLPEQTLEEIVEGFKRGVAESLSPEDFDTHYNLGIAYREMGLLDEAIGEFQLAAKDPKYLIDCCSLLGASFLDKGLPELAVKWFQRGLETPDLPEEATLGLLYDLGNLYLGIGEIEKARKTFVEIYGVNSNYRDVVAKLEELGRAPD